jgi:phosphohistidine phosphatase
MKKLFIVRHAKSSWKDMSLDDFDRPLNKRGRKNAPFMGKLLKDKGICPDIILSSPANRAKTTAQIMSKELEYEKEILFDEEIYESTPTLLDKKIKKIGDEVNMAFIFGHNPELNALAEGYVGISENIVTCGIVEIDFDCESWSDIDAQNAKLISYEYPKKFV